MIRIETKSNLIDVSTGNSNKCFKLKHVESSAAIDISRFSGNCHTEHLFDALFVELTF